MTDKEKILTEIERRRDAILEFPENHTVTFEAKCAITSMTKGLIGFINSLHEEPVSEEVRTKAKEIFDSYKKIDVSDDKKNRIALGLLELEALGEIFYELAKETCGNSIPVSEDLEKAAAFYVKCHGEVLGIGKQTFKAGALWAYEHPNLLNNEKYHTVKVEILDRLYRKEQLYDNLMEKACSWFTLNMEKLLKVPDIEYNTNETDVKDFIEDFRKAMEE